MPAATLAALQEYEAQFDAALPLVLRPFTQAPYGFALFDQDTVEVLTTPRIEYQFSLGEPTGPSGEFQLRAEPGLAALAVARAFSLRFVFVFDQTKLAAPAAGFKGALRALLAPPAPGAEEAAAFNTTTLPWLCISALNEVRATRGVLRGEERAKDLSIWETEWSGIFSVRESAFPA